MLKIYKQNLAEDDLVDIWGYTYQRWGESKADSYLDELEVALNSIADNPYIGITCDSIRKGYRQYHIKRHVVFYVVDDESIHIIRVLYDQMDFLRHLLGK